MTDRRTTLTRDPGPTEDPLISAAACRGLAASITPMTLWRWRKAGIIPAPTVIRSRNYWRRSEFLAAIAALDGENIPEPDHLALARAARQGHVAAT